MYCELRTLAVLCARCQTALDGFQKSSERKHECVYQVTTFELRPRAEGGCEICLRAWGEICRRWKDQHRVELSSELEEIYQSRVARRSKNTFNFGGDSLVGGGFDLDVRWRWTAFHNRSLEIFFTSPPEHRIALYLGLTMADRDMHSAFKPGSLLKPADAYGAMIAQISRWLEQDMKFHQTIDGDTSPSWCPKRLIEILAPDGDLVRIVNTESWDHGAAYATLSYRWPGGDFLTATKSNMLLLQSEDGFATSRLLPIFQGAIRVVRNLGLKYAWIDSLCIMQDDQSDWASEAPKMSEVYSNAQLTLTFNGDPLTSESPIDLLAQHIATSVSASLSPYFLDDEGDGLLDDVGRYLLASPLASRGWCYQERVLSKRLVHFFPTTVIWERIGGGPNRFQTLREPQVQLSLAVSNNRRTGMYKEELLDVVLGCTKSDRESTLSRDPRSSRLLDSWLSGVEEYTKRDLTHKEDRLIAFSAVARKFEEFMGDSYVLGCFAGFLLECLCWSFKTSQRECKMTRLNAESCRIPSWTWATVDGEIYYSSKFSLAHRENSINAGLASVKFYEASDGNEPGRWQDTKAIQGYGLLLPARISSVHKSADADVGFASFKDGLVLKALGFPRADTSASRIRTYAFRLDLVTDRIDDYDSSFFLPLHTGPYVASGRKHDSVGPNSTIVFSCEGLLLMKSSRYPDAYERYGCAQYHKRIEIPEASNFDLHAACAKYQQALEERELEAGVEFLLV